MPKLGPGSLLIASPALADPNFRRTVVLLCDHSDASSMGLVLNRPLQVPVSKVVPGLEGTDLEAPGPTELAPRPDAVVHSGGPVETHRMLVLARHRGPDGEPDAFDDDPGFTNVALVSDVEDAVEEIRSMPVRAQDYRFFLGYAGWGEHQLADELEEQAWIVRPATTQLIFNTPPPRIWAEALRELGGLYALYAEMPPDPQMN